MMKRVLHFLGYWLWLGFTGGAGVLLFVAAPLAEFLAQAGVSRGNAELALAGVAALWVLFSAGLAFLLERNLTARYHTHSYRKRFALGHTAKSCTDTAADYLCNN